MKLISIFKNVLNGEKLIIIRFCYLLVCQTEFLKVTVFLRSNSMHNFVFCVLCQILVRLRFLTGTSTGTRNTLNLYIFIKFHIPVVVNMNKILKIILNVNKCLKNLFFFILKSLSRDRYLNDYHPLQFFSP